MKMSEAFGVAAIVLSAAAVIYSLYWYSSLPVVRVNAVTGECVEVLAEEGRQYNCRLMPMKYVVERVSPDYSVKEEEDE